MRGCCVSRKAPLGMLRASRAKTVAASVVSGRVLVERPGTTTFVLLTASTLVSVGSTLDATNGKVIRIDGMLNAKTRLIDADISAPPNAIVGEAFHAVITIGTFEGSFKNNDTGTGRFRGIVAPGNDEAQPIFEQWLKPFNDLGATAVMRASTAPP